jgi:hypothetical protein
MNLAEVLAAALVLAVASGGSLRIWAAAATASRTAEQRQQQLVQLDGALLAAEAQLQGGLAQPDCEAAGRWMAAELERAPLPEGVQRQLALAPGGVWLRLYTQALPQRQRWLDAAALGLCAPPAAEFNPGSEPDPESESQEPSQAEEGTDGITV